MNDNEKAAMAAGLWAPGDETFDNPIITPEKRHELKEKFNVYCAGPAPDMHLPENLWRALENLGKRKVGIQLNVVFESDKWVASLFREYDGVMEPTPFFADGSLAGVILEALVALYDAEHQNESAIV